MKFKKYMSVLLIILLACGLMLSGCNIAGDQQEEEQQVEQVTTPQTETLTLTGEFQGLADGHSAEVIVDVSSCNFIAYS